MGRGESISRVGEVEIIDGGFAFAGWLLTKWLEERSGSPGLSPLAAARRGKVSGQWREKVFWWFDFYKYAAPLVLGRRRGG
jgi:hypothetical protein